ncbi:MAG TPA: hypothetical protein VE870_00545 [Bacteroidales bacterium]|nr:hypothetical protein [Bacteroidales bacterium]
MKKLLFPLFLLLVFLASCSSKKEIPVLNEDTVTLSTEFFGASVYYVYGYSFEQSKKVTVSFPDTRQVADIVPSRLQQPDGSVIGAQFSTMGNNPNGFNLKGSFSTLQEATDFYHSLTTVEDTTWNNPTDMLAPFQVYVFKTYKENFVKFMVTNVNIVNTGTPSENYVEIEITYFIQRDGSPNV